MQKKTSALQDTAKATELIINTNKAKSLRIILQNNSTIICNNKPDKDVKSSIEAVLFKNEDIRTRLGKARHAFVKLKLICRSKNIMQLENFLQNRKD